MAWGILANAGVTALAAAAYLLAAGSAQRRQRRLGHATSAAPLFLAMVALFLTLAALRQLAAFAATRDLGFAEWDRRIYLFLLAPAGLAIAPHVYMVTQVHSGSRAKAQAVAAFFALVVLVGLWFCYTGGVTRDADDEYGTEWTLDSRVAGVLILLAILLPGLAGSGWLLHLSRKLAGFERRRVALIGWSSLVYFAIFTIDALGLSGPSLLAARIVTAGTGVLAWWAYQEPKVHTYAPPPEKPGENPFGR